MTATLTTDKRQATGDINSVTKKQTKECCHFSGEKRKYYEQWSGPLFGRLPSHSQTLQNLFLGKF